MTLRLLLPIATALASGDGASQPPHAPPPAPAPSPALADTDADRAAMVERLAATLEDNFVFPDIAHRYAAALRAKAAAGGYANLGDPSHFGETVTADLQAISPDRHLRFGPTGAGPGPAGPGPGPGRGHRPPARELGGNRRVSPGQGEVGE